MSANDETLPIPSYSTSDIDALFGDQLLAPKAAPKLSGIARYKKGHPHRREPRELRIRFVEAGDDLDAD